MCTGTNLPYLQNVMTPFPEVVTLRPDVFWKTEYGAQYRHYSAVKFNRLWYTKIQLMMYWSLMSLFFINLVYIGAEFVQLLCPVRIQILWFILKSFIPFLIRMWKESYAPSVIWQYSRVWNSWPSRSFKKVTICLSCDWRAPTNAN